MIGIALMFALGWALTLRWSRRERELHRLQDALQRIGGRPALELLLRHQAMLACDRLLDRAVRLGHLHVDGVWLSRPSTLSVEYSAYVVDLVAPSLTVEVRL